MFDELDYLAPTKTIECPLAGVRTPPSTDPVTLQVIYAGSGTAFFNEFTKLKAPTNDVERRAYRERAARLFAKHAVTGWLHVCEKGAAVAFSEVACSALFVKLLGLKDGRGEQVGRWDLIDGVIAEAMDPARFTEAMVPASDLGKG